MPTAFQGAAEGGWSILRVEAILGDSLPVAARLAIGAGDAPEPAWTLKGFTSNKRYTTRAEAGALDGRPAPLDRPAATRGALIPIRKSQAWWDMAQDERREVFEAQSRHIGIGLDYMPRIARRLYHSRDIGEPFDFLTWFEFAPADEPAFDDLLDRLRASVEWRYVEREVEVRVARAG